MVLRDILSARVEEKIMDEKVLKKVAARAYELFLARGGRHGYHMADWLVAEKEILAAKKPAATTKTVKKKAVEKKKPVKKKAAAKKKPVKKKK